AIGAGTGRASKLGSTLCFGGAISRRSAQSVDPPARYQRFSTRRPEMRISRLIGGLFTATALLAACRDAQTEKKVATETSGGDVKTSMSGDSADKRGVALVRVVSAVPGKTLIVRADPQHQLAEAGFKEITDYKPIDKNWVTFEVSSAGDTAFRPLATNREMLTDGYRYTMVIIPDSGAKGFE